MKLYIALFALGVASVTESFVVHNTRERGDNIAARIVQQVADSIALGEQDDYAQHPAAQAAPKPAGSTFANIPPSNSGTLKRRRIKAALGNPAAARSQGAVAFAAATQNTQKPVTTARNINKEIKEVLLNPEEGRAADNSFSSLLLAAIASSNGDLPIISI
ncbi:hypothetical protein GGI01_000698 [Coemansia sp. RSA 376]|nr:hypothetical protein GGI14_006122 [Coemansia sp. S680]KAJ2031169.1 hypothetical protein H4S03_006747 [Coemansia sp. S3946]KAJ2042835.1 hypothetical protein H4S04_007092 [Coemansia sp. S16]KAJ2069951.1 hypothetical protein GGI08_000072 [Coemansia sp. S2]KAJ2073336.1 hypothetical protein GGH13_002071 [Coemansia sp. S155-1]KAJ2263486.1 hypothetical protein GGI01_000698 [Coemansia sp. RSA 376]KAJ2354450.1 hypothetical protein GGH92_000027 [Coemansia sp. RSA 2673]KAJ2432247.1 hypothetical prot